MEISNSTFLKPFSLRIFHKRSIIKSKMASSKNIFIKKDESLFFITFSDVSRQRCEDYLLVGSVVRVDVREETRLPLFTR